MLLDGDCDRALVIGTDAVTPFVAQGFAALQGLSPGGARPFDASRDGLSLGEAGCAVILQRVEDAPQAPRMTGWGCSNDANHISGPSRDGSGLALAIQRAYVGLDKSRTVALCGHGTATRYNDAMEALAFQTVFGNRTPPVFGIKGSIGHTLGAAGLIELALSARVASTGEAPPTFGFSRADAEFPLDVVHSQPRKFKPGAVLTTNSGFGGMNTAIVVERGGG
jgi:3-oxoacyl-[acyl-carrier-protein] synthase II